MSVKSLISSKDIIDIVDTFGKAKVVLYSNLPRGLNRNIGYFILYEIEPMDGHWTLLFYDNNEDTWHFFDPYGIILDKELDFTYYPTDYKESKPLMNLIFGSGFEDWYEINDIPYQEFAKNINTCGKWCIMRYLCYKLGYSNEWFQDKFEHLGDKKLSDLFYYIFK